MKGTAAVLAGLALATSAAQANEMHRVLSQMAPEQRDQAFAALLNRIGEACLGVEQTYFQGFDKRGIAYWSVTCTGGKSLSVSLSDQNGGTVRALNCKVLEKTTKTKCFTRF